MLHRSDGNQKKLIKELRQIGASVLCLSNVGKCPDICVGYAGKNYLCEIKSSPKAKLTPAQELFFMQWDGQVSRIESIEDFLKIVEKYKDMCKIS